MKVLLTLVAAVLLLPCQAFQSPPQWTQARNSLDSSFVRPKQETTTSSFKINNGVRRQTTSLEASPLTALAASPIGSLSVLASVVLVHEAGHYLAARSFNISVEEFSIGFGPKLAGFKALGNEFNLRGFPLGGYVRFPENYDTKEVEKLQREAEDAFAQRRKDEGWGAKENALYLLTFGQWDERRKRLRRQEAESAALEAAAAPKPWWKFGNRNKTPKVETGPEDFEIEYYDDPNLLQNRNWFQRAVVLSMGVIFNMILAFTIYFGTIGPLGNGLPQPVFDSGVVVNQAPVARGPAVNLLQKGDVIVGINGELSLNDRR